MVTRSPLTFSLRPIPPFRLDYTTWALRRRPRNRIDRWDGHTYARAMVINGTPVSVSVSQVGTGNDCELKVTLEGKRRLTDGIHRGVSDALKRMLGTDIDLSEFYDMAARDTKLWELVKDFHGLKPPRFPAIFEALVNAVACQQLSLAVGIILMNRLAEACSPSVATADGPAYAFPRPSDVLKVGLDNLRKMGFSRQKGTFLLGLARAVSTAKEGKAGRIGVQKGGGFDLEEPRDLENQQVAERLYALKGVGRWSAEYVLLRGLGRLSVFPGDDVGGRKKLANWLDLPDKLTYEDVRSVTSTWGHFAGLVYFHLLLRDLKAHGYLHAEGSSNFSR